MRDDTPAHAGWLQAWPHEVLIVGGVFHAELFEQLFQIRVWFCTVE